MTNCEDARTIAAEDRPTAGIFAWRGLWAPVAVITAYVPLLLIHGRELWLRPHYQFFPLVVPAAAALVARTCLGLGPLQGGPRGKARLLGILAWAALAIAVLFASPRAAALAVMVALPAAAYSLGGLILVRAAAPAWCLLWMAVPPPYRFDYWVIGLLQDTVSRWSSDLLDAIGIFHLMSGHVVEIGGRQLLVDQACSGIYSLFALMLGTLLFIFWFRTSIARGAVLMIATVFWVVFGNVARIVTIVAVYTRTGHDVSSGWPHEVLGLVIFCVMLGMVVSTDRLITGCGRARVWYERWNNFLLFEPSDQLPSGDLLGPIAAEPCRPPRTVLPSLAHTWVGSRLSGVAFGVLLVLQFTLPGVSLRDAMVRDTTIDKAFVSQGLDALPARVGAYNRTGYRAEDRDDTSSLGEHSRIWGYRKGDVTAVVSLDYKFVDWHDLEACYTGQGWMMTGRRLESPPRNNAAPALGRPGGGALVVANFVNLEGRFGHLIFGLFDRQGRGVDSPWVRRWYLTGVIDRLTNWARRGPARDPFFINYQLQVFLQSETPLSPSEHKEALGLFEDAASRFSRRFQQGRGVMP